MASMSYKLMSSPEAKAAAKELRPLVKETRAAIASLAMQGIKEVDRLSPDKGYPMDLPSKAGGTGGLHRIADRRIIRQVSPKINADRTIEGFSDLSVVHASTTYIAKMMVLYPFLSLKNPGHGAAIELPFTKWERRLKLGITGKDLDFGQRVLPAEYQPTISVEGDASMGTFDLRPRAPHPNGEFRSADEVRAAYYYAYPECLAISGLVARGLRALGLNIDIEQPRALFNEWQLLRGDEQIGSGAFWTLSGHPYLQSHLQ